MKLRDARCKRCGGPPVDLSQEWLDRDVKYDSSDDASSSVFTAFGCAQGHLTPIVIFELPRPKYGAVTPA